MAIRCPFLLGIAIFTGKIETMEFLRDLWGFLKERKKWWLMPLILVILLIGVLLIFAESSAIGSFIYTLF